MSLSLCYCVFSHFITPSNFILINLFLFFFYLSNIAPHSSCFGLFNLIAPIIVVFCFYFISITYVLKHHSLGKTYYGLEKKNMEFISTDLCGKYVLFEKKRKICCFFLLKVFNFILFDIFPTDAVRKTNKRETMSVTFGFLLQVSPYKYI